MMVAQFLWTRAGMVATGQGEDNPDLLAVSVPQQVRALVTTAGRRYPPQTAATPLAPSRPEWPAAR